MKKPHGKRPPTIRSTHDRHKMRFGKKKTFRPTRRFSHNLSIDHSKLQKIIDSFPPRIRINSLTR